MIELNRILEFFLLFFLYPIHLIRNIYEAAGHHKVVFVYSVTTYVHMYCILVASCCHGSIYAEIELTLKNTMDNKYAYLEDQLPSVG